MTSITEYVFRNNLNISIFIFYLLYLFWDLLASLFGNLNIRNIWLNSFDPPPSLYGLVQGELNETFPELSLFHFSCFHKIPSHDSHEIFLPSIWQYLGTTLMIAIAMTLLLVGGGTLLFILCKLLIKKIKSHYQRTNQPRSVTVSYTISHCFL